MRKLKLAWYVLVLSFGTALYWYLDGLPDNPNWWLVNTAAFRCAVSLLFGGAATFATLFIYLFARAFVRGLARERRRAARTAAAQPKPAGVPADVPAYVPTMRIDEDHHVVIDFDSNKEAYERACTELMQAFGYAQRGRAHGAYDHSTGPSFWRDEQEIVPDWERWEGYSLQSQSSGADDTLRLLFARISTGYSAQANPVPAMTAGTPPMLTGLNHLTLAVRDLDRSLDFYVGLLGFALRARWQAGAYLSLGDLWLCLSRDPLKAEGPAPDYTHYAFGIAQEQFSAFLAHLRAHGVAEWRANRSEGDSVYFLDPDGHKLEAHVGDIDSRLAQCRRQPYEGMQIVDAA